MLPRSSPRFSIIAACTLTGAAWLIHEGPVPVIRITTPLPEAAPFWYMLLAFPVLGMLVADLVDLYRLRGISVPTVELAVQIGLLVALSSVRLGAGIPVSGHSLLVSCFILRRLLLRPFPPRHSTLEVVLAFGVLGAVAYPKLAWWNDPVTLLAGAAVGALLAAASRWINRRHALIASPDGGSASAHGMRKPPDGLITSPDRGSTSTG